MTVSGRLMLCVISIWGFKVSVWLSGSVAFELKVRV